MLLRTSTAAALAAVLAVSAGCGGPSDDAQVRATLRDYATATGKRDVQALCDDLLAPQLVAHAADAGLPCEVAFRQALQGVARPSLRVESVQIKGDRALARVHTTAVGQQPSDDTVLLMRFGSHWRIASLALPEPQPLPRTGP